ncbi:MAG: KGK domain-containing protein [Spirulinaceae cyanobacterium]
MDNKFEPLSGGEVLSVDDSVQFLIGHTTFRAEELSQALRTQILEHGIGGLTEAKKHWLTENGINCEVLRFGANGWQKGKVRISLEFCPSEGEAEDLEESIGSEDESGLSAFEQEDDSDLEELALDADEPTIIEEEFAVEAESDSNFGDASIEQEESELDFLPEEEEEPVLDITEEAEMEAESELDFGDAFTEQEEEATPIALGGESQGEIDPELVDLGNNLFGEEEESLDFNGKVTSESDMDIDLDLGSNEEDLNLAELENSIEEELELVEASEKDGEFDLAEMEQGNDGFDVALSGEPDKEKEEENLFDDVWQDIN